MTVEKVDFGGAGTGIWWEEIGRTTLLGSADAISVASIPTRKHLKIRVIALDTGGTINTFLRFNNDSAANYAVRVSTDGGADAAVTGEPGLAFSPATAANPIFAEFNVINITAQEKLISGDVVARNTAGSGTAPRRRELSGKWANTSDQITRVDLVNTAGTGDYAAGSELVILGHD